jgi:hypothetical protein
MLLLQLYPHSVQLLGNIGFGHWLSVLSRGSSHFRVLWFLFGLWLGINGVILFYLLILVHSAVSRSQSQTNA